MNSTAVQSNKSPSRLATQSQGATLGTAQGGKQPPADGAVWRVKREGKKKHGSSPLAAAKQLVEQAAQRQAQADDAHGKHDGNDECHSSSLLRRVGGRGLVAAKDAPVHVGPQVFAADSAACGPLDGGTVLGGHAAHLPVAEALGGCANAFSKGEPPLARVYCLLQCFTHGAITHHVYS